MSHPLPPPHTHILKPTKQPRVQLPARLLQNPSSLSSSNSPAQRKKNSALSACWRADEPFRGESRQKPRRRRQNNDVANDTVTIQWDRSTPTHPPRRDFYVLFPSRGCVCVKEGAERERERERGRRHRRVSLLLASIRALPFPRKGMRKRRVTRPARERNVACTIPPRHLIFQRRILLPLPPCRRSN